MKRKIILLVLIAFIGFSNDSFCQKNDWGTTIYAILQAMGGNQYKATNITTQTIAINSTSNAKFKKGVSREVFNFTLPEGTKSFSVRVTVIPIKSNYQYENNETFFYRIQNNQDGEIYAPQNKGINFYVFVRSFDVDAFTNKNNFTVFGGNENTNSFIQSYNAEAGNYWIGVENTDVVYGLKAIVEVVALGYYHQDVLPVRKIKKVKKIERE